MSNNKDMKPGDTAAWNWGGSSIEGMPLADLPPFWPFLSAISYEALFKPDCIISDTCKELGPW